MRADDSGSSGGPASRDLRRFYEEKEAVYHSQESRVGHRERVVLALFPLDIRLRVLDVGCGSGSFLRVLKGLGHEGVGLEISATAVEAANQSGVRAMVGNAETKAGLDAVGNDFDVITLLDVLEHTFDPPQMLRHLGSLLRPDGCIIASVPNLGCFTARWRILWGQFPSEPSGIFDSGHIRWFTLGNLADYINRAGGFRLQSCDATGIPPFNLRGYWRMEHCHDFIFTGLARLWPSLFAHQLVFKLAPAGPSLR